MDIKSYSSCIWNPFLHIVQMPNKNYEYNMNIYSVSEIKVLKIKDCVAKELE